LGSLQDRLNGAVKSIELNGGEPETMTQRWVLLSREAGIIQLESMYLLVPVEIKKILSEFLDLGSRDVDKVCNLIIEKGEGQQIHIKLIYDIKQRWRFKT
jgi:hypothetical protein